MSDSENPTEEFFKPAADANGDTTSRPSRARKNFDPAPVVSTSSSEATLGDPYAGSETAPTAGPADGSAFKKQSKALPVVAVAVAAALIGGAAGAGVTLLVNQDQSNIFSSSANQAITINDPQNVNTVSAVVAKVSPSVVTIEVTDGTSGGTGSGEFISSDGYILTNNHVATLDGQVANPTIKVQDNEGRIFDATIVGTDPTVDLAVLKIDATGLTPIEWGDSNKLNVGQPTIAMGAPLGLAGTVTTGIISALNRSIQIASSQAPDTASQGDTNSGANPFDFWNFDNGQTQTQTQQTTSSSISVPVIQTDAAINPGNSGGPLLDSTGKLIGINVAIASADSTSSQSGSIGLGFALPANLAKRVSEELIAQQKATHGLLGASISDGAYKDNVSLAGAYVEKVTEGGPAAAAGIRADDIITNFNGVRVTNANDLTAQVRMAPGGSDATVVFIRDGKEQTVTVKLGTL